MLCREFEDRLNLLLDERQPPGADPQLADHVAGCEGCRQLLAGQEAVLAGLRQWQAPRLGADFSRRVLAERHLEPVEAVVLDREPTARRRWLLVAGLLGTAAAALLAVTIAAFNSGGEPKVAVSPAVPTQPHRPTVNPRLPNRAVVTTNPSPRDKVGTGRRAVQPSALSMFTRPTGGYGVAIADMASNLPEAVEQLDEVERYAPGIRPIRVSFTMLFEAFWRAIPGMGADGAAQRGATYHPSHAARLV